MNKFSENNNEEFSYVNKEQKKSTHSFVTDNNNEFNKYSLEKLKITHLHGSLSSFFGANDYVPVHIAGIISILLVVTGIVLSFRRDNFKEHWDIFLPIITMCIGYIFGKKPE